MTQIRTVGRPTWAGATLLALVAFAALIGMRAGDAQGAGPKTVGNDVIDRPTQLSLQNYLIIDRQHPADAAGTVRSFSVFADTGGDIQFVLVDAMLVVKYVSPVHTVGAGATTVGVPGTPPVVQVGWFIGMFGPSGSAVAVDETLGSAALPVKYRVFGPTPTVGEVLPPTLSDGPNNVYSIRGNIGCGSTCYANAVTGNNTTGDGRTPATAYQTIQKALDNVDSGGTVVVAPGSYNEFGLASVPVTVNGPNMGIPGNAVRNPEATAYGIGADADNVTVNGFRFSSSGFFGTHVSTQSNVLITNNLFDGASATGFITCVNLCSFTRNLVQGNGSFGGLQLGGFGITVANNEFANNNTANTEVVRAFAASSFSVTENYFHDNSWPCGFLCTGEYPIVVGVSSNVSILRNRIVSANMGIVLDGTSTGVTIKNNFLHADTYAFWSNAFPSSGVTVQENSILATTNGMEFWVGHTGPFDATKNWWGDKTGPSGDGPGSGTPIEDLSGQVDFDPWLCLGTDIAPLVPGFQPNLTQQATGTTPCDTTPPIATVTFTTVGGTFVAWPGGWNKNRVIATFVCSDPESGIDKNSLPRNLTFVNDGEFTVGIHGLTDDDECVNGMGLVAAPVPVAAVTFRIDRQAPSCVSVPSSQTIPKMIGWQTVNIVINTADGYWTGGETKKLVSITGDKGATAADWVNFVIGSDDTYGTFNTAVKGRVYTLTYEVKDLAGWTDTCTSKVRVAS